MLSKVMDFAAARHAVLANNLANVNTPGFKRSDLQFKEALAKAIDSKDVTELRNLEPEVVEDNTQSVRADGNNVSAHTEMTAMTQNELLFQVSARFLSSKILRLKSAMK
jgi:flagellar basal-body rod protein FlgB